MKKIDQNNQVQTEALINECKGNLFEFLVCQKLSQIHFTEGNFYQSLSDSYRKRLKFYEETLSLLDPTLKLKLHDLAQSTVKTLNDKNLFSGWSQAQFQLIGKMSANTDFHLWSETDILCKDASHSLFISLKLSKEDSFLNTKSAGVKSFFEKYFQNFHPTNQVIQNEFNQEVDNSFKIMGHTLYKAIDQDFSGHFDQRWTNYYSELPGELPEELREIVHESYRRLTNFLATKLVMLHQKDQTLFKKSLESLCGFSSNEIVQVHCAHENNVVKSVGVTSYQDLFSFNDQKIKFEDHQGKRHHLDIILPKMTLQLRIKPMNKFTTPSYKVNCAIKLSSQENL